MASMARTSLIALAAGALLLGLGVILQQQAVPVTAHDVFLDGGAACPGAPVRILEPVQSAPAAGSLVVFHGLGANRLVMLPLGRQFAAAGFRVFLVDSPGHGVNPAPFSFASNEACARGVLARLERSGEITPRRTVLLGHSMGGGLVIRLADNFLSAGTIAVAGAPVVRPHRLPANLLLVAPQFDMPPILEQERELGAAAGATRDSAEDFRQWRGFMLLRVPWQTHTSPIFSPGATRAMVRWALNSVGASASSAPQVDHRTLHGALLGLAGILMMFPAALDMFAKLAGRQPPQNEFADADVRIVLLAWPAAGIFAAIVVGFWMPLSRLHLFGGDYLGSFLLVAGLPLAMGFSSRVLLRPHRPGTAVAAATVGLVAALAISSAVGGWSNRNLAELWPIAARWACLPLLAAALLPACFAEECALGSPGPWFSGRGARRWLLFMGLRGILWSAMLAAFWFGASAALLPVIFAGPLGGVSLGARIGADLVRRRTGSATGAAVFDAILMAWFVAAVFPLA